ncbi:unnamed protein product [Pylaiella littoralis]
MPRMPGMKNPLNISIGQAANLRAKQREELPGHETNGASVGSASRAEQASQRPNEAEDKRQSIPGEERERETNGGKALRDERVDQGKQANRRAMRGIQSIKESLQTRLLGTSSGKLPAEGEHPQNEEMEGGESQDDEVHDLPSESGESSSSARRSGSPSNVPAELDELGASQAQIQRENSQKGLSRDKTGSAPSSDGGSHAEKRKSGYNTPLRSLLQDATAGDQETHESKGGEEDENSESDGDDAVSRDTSESHAAKGTVGQAVSAPGTTSVVKAAASKLTSKFSSPKLGSTLKGFGWNRPTKEDVVKCVPSSPSASPCDPAHRISSTTPTGVDEASESATELGGSSVPRPQPSDAPTTTVLVTVFRASGLPETSTKNLFGRTKKTSTQHSFVRLDLCGVSASTSAVEGGGRECKWGKKREGHIVEISIPSPNVPAAGVGASKMVVEVWTKASDEAGKDALLGSTEVLVADWLGEKAKWVALEAKRSQGGRVKLGVSLKDGDGASSLPPNGDGTDDAPVDGGSASGTKDDEAGLISPNTPASSTPSADVIKTLQHTGETPPQNGAASETEEVRSHGGSKASVPLLAASPLSGEGQQQGTLLEEESSTGASPPAVKRNLEQQEGVSAEVVKGEGGEEIDVGSLAQEQNVPSTGQGNDLETVGSHLDDNQLSAASSHKPSISPHESEVLKGRELEGDDHGHEIEVHGKEDIPSNLCVEPPEENVSIDLPSPAKSKRSSTGSLDEFPLKQERSSSGADMGPTTTAEDAGARTVHAVKNDENVEIFSEVGDSPEVPDVLARRVAGGTATTLDLTAAALPSDERTDNNIAEEQSMEAGTSLPREHESEPPQSIPQGSKDLRQTAPIPRKRSGINGLSHGQDQEQTDILRGSRDLRAGGDPGDGGRDGSVGIENGSREVSSEGRPKETDAQPRRQTNTREVNVQRVARAREIIRRHRAAISTGGPTCAGVQIGGDLAILTTTEQARAAATVQGAFRGRIARRRLRLRQRAAVRVQAAYRGHVDRKDFVALRVRARRAKAEEKRARARRSRIAFITQELNLLRNTPAQQLLRVDALRAEACASRIQRFWRRFRGPEGVPRLCEDDARDMAPVTSCTKNREHSLTAPEISSRRNRISLSGMTLEALRLRVANRQRAKERFPDDGGREGFLTLPRTSEFSASQLAAAFHQSETTRLAAAKRRKERLAKFRKIQDQLLRPPKLSRSGDANLSPEQFEKTTSGDSRRRHLLDIMTDKSWNLAEGPAQRDRAQRAHSVAVAAARGRGRKAWATSLPPDVGYDELVDIRTVHVPSWSTTSLDRGGRPDFVDGLIHNRTKPSRQVGPRPSDREFDSDEASLWWYTYATEGAHTACGPRGDRVFAELLERAKTTPTRRKEHAERGEQQHQLRVAQKRQRIIDGVIHKQRVASCTRLPRARGHGTEAQRCSAIRIQAYIRGFLERKATAVLRAEMRVFDALQVLVKELRQPDLDEGDATNSLAAFLADRMNGQGDSRGRGHHTGRRSRTPRGGCSGPTSPAPTSPVMAVSSFG